MKKSSIDYFKCEECGFLHKNKAMAEKCPKWCAGHKNCNLDIIKHSVKIDEDKIHVMTNDKKQFAGNLFLKSQEGVYI